MSVDNLRTGANINVRTSVLNLVICAPDVESARYASKLLRDLSSTHIARVTLVILDRSADALDAFESWVTLRCFSVISDLMRHCFEQATLLASGRATCALPSLLPAVLKAHLPVYLWWIGDTRGADDTVFRTMSELCQRVIVDSATFFHPERDIQALASYCQETPTVALSDLNWGRLTPWRHLVAQFFDVSAYLPFLAEIECIEIEYVAAPLASVRRTKTGEVSPNPTGALLLAGWLKARLNMSLASEGEKSLPTMTTGAYQWLLDLPSGTKQAILQIQPHIQADLRPGSIYLVRLTCTSQNKRTIFTTKRDADTNYVQTSVHCVKGPRPMRTVKLPDRHQ
ncbi:MAG: glucose-6-phosphate dehydrogenase assembly protein OpcA, partial [Candidatus Micrarchaeaceae archaeon]